MMALLITAYQPLRRRLLDAIGRILNPITTSSDSHLKTQSSGPCCIHRAVCRAAGGMESDSRLHAPGMFPTIVDVYISIMHLLLPVCTGYLKLHRPPGYTT
jgi:hypothetical protein